MRAHALASAGAALAIVAVGALAAAVVSRRTEGRAMQTTDAHGRRPNRLAREKSPYLLQHAYNPVDWYPWGEEAFAAAKRADKPIFLSVGYSTCYWCHVMEKESFENDTVAAVLNENFVSIKVDREERPDVDAVYMAAVQAMTGQGGWPMTVLLTPDGKPFWGGTYFPAVDQPGRPGLVTILRTIADAWRTRRDDVLRSGDTLTRAIQARADSGEAPGALTASALDSAVVQLSRAYDAAEGGFGPAPKFPRTHALSFLLRTWYRTRAPHTLQMVEGTLDAMDRGGIHDHLGGGFHRYSTDAAWLVPHFEKMLYDQALISRTYLEAYQVTRRARYADVARDVFDYVLRDLRAPEGGFYSAEDAGAPGKEGEYYVWTRSEIDQALGSDAALFADAYGVTPQGNFEHRTTVLSAARPLAAVAAAHRVSEADAARRLGAARARLLAVRNARVRPHRDDKVLTDWNALMIGALAYGGRVLDEPRYTRAAEDAARFVQSSLVRDGHLLHRYRDGDARVAAFLDDYAFLVNAFLDLYEATFDPSWLAAAQSLGRDMVQQFWDEERGGFFMSGARNETLIARKKELYDGALPSGNSMAALAAARLGILTMDPTFQRAAERTFRAFAAEASATPYAYTQFLAAFDLWLGPAQEVVIAGRAGDAATAAMLRTAQTRYLPRSVLALAEPGHAGERLSEIVPFVRGQSPIDGRATAYVCQNYVCTLPTTDTVKLGELLDTHR